MATWRFVKFTVTSQDGTVVEIYTPSFNLLMDQNKRVVPSFELVPVTGFIEVHSFQDGTETVESCTLVETGQTFPTPANLEVSPGTYHVQVRDQTQQTTIAAGQTIVLNFNFSTSPDTGFLDIHSSQDGTETIEDVLIVETSQTHKTPILLEVTPGNYTIQIRDLTKTAAVFASQTVRVDFNFKTAPLPSKPSWTPLAIGAGLILVSI